MRELANKSQPSLQRRDAEQFIMEFLQHSGGRAEVGALADAANAAEVSTTALRNAKAAMINAGTVKRVCESQGRGKGSKWYLEAALPELADNEPFEDDHNEE